MPPRRRSEGSVVRRLQLAGTLRCSRTETSISWYVMISSPILATGRPGSRSSCLRGLQTVLRCWQRGLAVFSSFCHRGQRHLRIATWRAWRRLEYSVAAFASNHRSAPGAGSSGGSAAAEPARAGSVRAAESSLLLGCASASGEAPRRQHGGGADSSSSGITARERQLLRNAPLVRAQRGR